MLDPHVPLLPEILALHGRWRRGRPTVVAPEGTLDWAAFDGLTNRVANRLLASGARHGDRVALVMTNGLEMVALIVGCMKAGCVVVPLNPASTDRSLAAMRADAGARFVFATADHAPKLAPVDGVVHVVAARQGEASAGEGWIDHAAWLGDIGDGAPGVAVAPEDVCNIIYSSGTTGEPKGIVHTHRNRLLWAQDIALALRYHAGARTLVTTGLHSNISWGAMLCTLLVGGTLVLRRAFDAGDALATIAAERITHTAMVPVQYQRLLQHPDFAATERASMQSMMCCGSPLPAAVKAQLFEAFGCGVIELYGSTEGIITTLPPEEIRILADGDRPAAPGELGEVVGRNRFLMRGYWRKPGATAEATWADESGQLWLRSGDIGRLDEHGYLYIVDRKKDMILSGGQNIYPADLEAILAGHPDVMECAVVGVPSAAWGESPLALVVPRPGRNGDTEEIRRWLNERVGKQQRVVGVELRDELPRNAAGKVLKRELRAPYWKAS